MNAAPMPPAREWFAQDPWEFEQMLAHVGGTRLLEVGTRYGESLRRMAARMEPGARVISVDLGDDPFSIPRTKPFLHEAIAKLRVAGYDAHLVLGDSHAPEIVAQVHDLGPFDFAFIDGDHSEAGVLSDWMDYGPIAKTIAFHDIRWSGVKRAWPKIREGRRFEEFCNPARTDMGIGVVLQ